MKTIPIILSVLAIGAFAAAPAEAKSRKHVRHYTQTHVYVGGPAYRAYASDRYTVRAVRNPYRVIGRSSDPRIRSRMRDDDDVVYGASH